MRFLRTIACGVAAALTLSVAGCGDSSDQPAPADAADQAFTFTIPIYKFYQTQRGYIAQGIVPNFFASSPLLSTSAMRTVTKPNHDTLYSVAFLKLGNGPIEIDTPESGARYFSLALMDAYTNNFAVRGTRVDGGHAMRFWVVGPDFTGTAPEGTVLLQSKTNSVSALARTYTSGTPDDYAAAHAVQAQLRIVQPADTPRSAFTATDQLLPPPETSFDAYFEYVDQLMTQDPPGAEDTAFVDNGPASIGVGPGLSYNPAAVYASAVTFGATQARNRALSPSDAATASGWLTATDDIGDYGTNYDLRAHLAETGLAALPRAEAVYFIANSAFATPGVPLSGDTPYTLDFPADGLPPTGAFWSLTLYEGQDASHAYFYANPDNIWAISYPASNPAFNDDGSLTLYISHVQPAGVPLSNWLPAPEGTYSLQLRDYLPTDDVLNGAYVLPALAAAG